jgi:glycolate oxidase FAD binding subunit
MTAPLSPATPAELTDAVRSTPRLIAVGGSTKPRLSAVDAVKLSTARLCGIIDYDPSEFTFTALAGTPLRDIAEALAERGQYLPFDPPLVATGATLGGTVAAGLSGPGRFRFGGVRDFILGVRFVDGSGRLLRLGGKVVKNAAGFDVPKFFVGSTGRFGVLAEVTFKVFPQPASTLTLRLPVGSVESVARMLIEASHTRWEPDALDLPHDGQAVYLRLAGPAAALPEIAREIFGRWPGEMLSPSVAEAVWEDLRELRWAHAGGVLVKVALTPGVLGSLATLVRSLEGARFHASVGGNVAWVSLASVADAPKLDEGLRAQGLAGVTIRGDGPLWCGFRSRSKLAMAVKEALDPVGRFPALDD